MTPEGPKQPEIDEGGVASVDVLASSTGPDERVEVLLDADASAEELVPHVVEQDAADAADTLERLESERSAEVLHQMDNATAAEALAYMEPALGASVLLDLMDRGEVDEAAELIGMISPDDAADLFQALPRATASDLLKRVHPKQAAQIGKLALYDPETAGGTMTTDIMVVRSRMTIGEAIDSIKKHHMREVQSTVFVVDDSRALVGEISLHALLVTDDAEPVEPHIETDLDVVTPEVDREEVARIFERYDYINLPVVDSNRRLLGMVTIDDVVDIIEAEATEDALKQVGAGTGEAVYSGVGTKLRGRGPWLLLNLVTAGTASSILLAFQGLIAEFAVAAVLFPIIANQSGNAGFQSLAVTLRGLVLGEIHPERVRPLIQREVVFGLIAGLVVGVVMALAAMVLGEIGRATSSAVLAEFTWRIGVVAGVAMAGALTASCLIGTLIPLAMKRIGADPATASSIFLTMLTDMTSFGTFLGLMLLLHGWVAGGVPVG